MDITFDWEMCEHYIWLRDGWTLCLTEGWVDIMFDWGMGGHYVWLRNVWTLYLTEGWVDIMFDWAMVGHYVWLRDGWTLCLTEGWMDTMLINSQDKKYACKYNGEGHNNTPVWERNISLTKHL